MKLKRLVHHPFHIKINPLVLQEYYKNLTQHVQDTMRGRNVELNLKHGGTYFYHFGLYLYKNFECET